MRNFIVTTTALKVGRLAFKNKEAFCLFFRYYFDDFNKHNKKREPSFFESTIFINSFLIILYFLHLFFWRTTLCCIRIQSFL